MNRKAAAAVFIALSLPLAACGTTQATGASPAAPSVSSSSPAPAPTTAQPIPDSELDTTAYARKFGETIKYHDGIELTVKKGKTFTPQYGGAKGTMFHVTVKNGSKVPVDLAMSMSSASLGDEAAEKIYGDGESELLTMPKLRPGKTVNVDIAFEGTKGDWVLEFQPDFEHAAATYASDGVTNQQALDLAREEAGE